MAFRLSSARIHKTKHKRTRLWQSCLNLLFSFMRMLVNLCGNVVCAITQISKVARKIGDGVIIYSERRPYLLSTHSSSLTVYIYLGKQEWTKWDLTRFVKQLFAISSASSVQTVLDKGRQSFGHHKDLNIAWDNLPSSLFSIMFSPLLTEWRKFAGIPWSPCDAYHLKLLLRICPFWSSNQTCFHPVGKLSVDS